MRKVALARHKKSRNNALAQRFSGCGDLAGLLPAFVVLCVLATACHVSQAQLVPDRDTLLLANFDGSLDADYSVGSPESSGRAKLVKGRFGQAVELGPGDQLSFVGNDGNFHPSEGTIEFWLKPHWPGNDGQKHSIFTCRFGQKGYININVVGNNCLGIALSSGEGEQWTWRRAEARIDTWKPEQWHHVVCTWGDGVLRIYIDGRLGQRTADDARMPDALPATLQLLGCDAAVDGFRISRRAYSAEQVRRAYRNAGQTPPFSYVEDLAMDEDGRPVPRQRVLLGDIRLPLVVGDRQFRKGFVARPGSPVHVELGGRFAQFVAEVGVEAFSPSQSACRFIVRTDGQIQYQTAWIPAGQTQKVQVPVRGVQRLELLVQTRSAPDAVGTTLGVWANAAVTKENAEAVFPPARRLEPATLEMYRRQAEADRFYWQMPRGQALCVASKFWEDELNPSQAPTREQLRARLKIMATPGEYEPTSFVVYARRDLAQVRVNAGDLRGEGNAIIPSDCIELRLVLRCLMRKLYTRPPEQSTVESRFLLPLEPVDIPAGTLREYFVTVHVPDDAKPGRYRTTLRVTAADGTSAEVPLEVEVLPFRLRPLKEKKYGIYYRFPQDESQWERAELELKDIREHGCTFLKTPLGVQFVLEDGQIRVSVSRLRKALKLLRKHGFHGPLPVSTGCPQLASLLHYDPVADYEDQASRERFFRLVREAMSALERLQAEFREFEFLPTHMDEVFGRDRLDRYIRFTEAVRKATSLRVYITLHNRPVPGIEQMMRRCDPFVDVRCYNGHSMDEWIRAGHSFEELADELRQSGDEAWTYYNIRGSFFKPEWTRLVNGFYLWISPLKAHVPWMYYSVKGNPLDDTDGGGHDFVYAVPDPRHPDRLISTRHWEAFREGVDDQRYLATLEQLIAERRDTDLARQAQTWLAQLRARLRPDPKKLQQVEGESPILRMWANQFDGPQYRQFRREVADWIMRLQGGSAARTR